MTTSASPASMGFHAHDHKACINTAIASAEMACQTAGLRLTPVRRRTLEILLEAHEALGAYDVLARLDAEGFGSKPRITPTPDLRIGYVPQKLAVETALPLTVRRFLNLPKRMPAKAVRAALARTGVEALENRQLAGLSGGQMQRVLLARAILSDPQILVLDEPTQGLDQPGAVSFYRLIEALRDDLGCAILMVSHELHVVMSATDRVICLNGHICCEGTPDVVTAAPAYRELFGSGTGGALALYRHEHDHEHCAEDHPA